MADRHWKLTVCRAALLSGKSGKGALAGQVDVLSGEAVALPDRQERRGACSQCRTCSVSFKEMVELLGLLSLDL